MTTREFQLKNTLPDLKVFQEELADFLEGQGVLEEVTHDVTLLSEELLINTMNHGYLDNPRDAIIEIELTLTSDSKLRMEFRDDAVAFNPLEAEERDLEDDRIGGWGIPLLKALTSKLEYRRADGRNILSFEYDLAPDQEA